MNNIFGLGCGGFGRSEFGYGALITNNIGTLFGLQIRDIQSGRITNPTERRPNGCIAVHPLDIVTLVGNLLVKFRCFDMGIRFDKQNSLHTTHGANADQISG